MHDLEVTENFVKQADKIVSHDKKLRTKLSKTINLLKTDPHHPSLKLHKLIGKDNWSVRVTGNIRIILRWRGSTLFCVQIGSHDEVY